VTGRVLVTGATGFVGRNVILSLLRRGKTVVGFSADAVAGFSPPALVCEAGDFVEVTGDVRDRDRLVEILRSYNVDQVIHLAAITPSGSDEVRLAQAAMDINVGGTAAVTQAVIECGIRQFVLASSVAVYGGGHPDGSWLDEEMPHAPATLYAISKDAAEKVVQRLGSQAGLDWKIGRLGRVFGPFEYETGVRATMSQIFIATEAAKAGRKVKFSRPCLKTWHYAPDAAEALVMLLDVRNPASRIYNLGSPHVWSLAEWCSHLKSIYPDFEYEITASDPVDDEILIDLNGTTDGGNLSSDRFVREIGSMPTRTLAAAFEDYVVQPPTDRAEGVHR